MPGDGIWRHSPQRDQTQYGPAGRVRYCLKYISAKIHIMQLFDCKYNEVI